MDMPKGSVPVCGGGQRQGVSRAGMALSVLVILLLAMLYEAIKMGKAVLLRRALLALPRSLSQELLAEPEEGGTGPAQGRYRRAPFAPGRRGRGGARGWVYGLWASAGGEKGCKERGSCGVIGSQERGMCTVSGGGPGGIPAPPGTLGDVQGVFQLS